MRDEEARGRIARLEDGVYGSYDYQSGYSISSRLNFLEERIVSGISIKDCPRCKHPVMAKEEIYPDDDWRDKNLQSWWRCLTCGCRFTCSNECVCREVRDEK